MHRWEKSIHEMLGWIEGNLASNPTLAGMSDQLGYSPHHCSAQFHAVTAMSFRAYVARRRLCRAVQALAHSDRRILDIAMDCGYQSHEALTRAIRRAYNCTPSEFRAEARKIGTSSAQDFALPVINESEVQIMIAKASVRIEYIPAHKYIGIYGEKTAEGQRLWPGHDCENVTSAVQEMSGKSDPIVTAHTAGWRWIGEKRAYFYGLGVPADYRGSIPVGFELREIPASYYLVFSHPAFEYPAENRDVMAMVEALAWSFDPATLGYAWNEGDCQDYQRHYPEGIGYQVLRPVKKI